MDWNQSSLRQHVFGWHTWFPCDERPSVPGSAAVVVLGGTVCLSQCVFVLRTYVPPSGHLSPHNTIYIEVMLPLAHMLLLGSKHSPHTAALNCVRTFVPDLATYIYLPC